MDSTVITSLVGLLQTALLSYIGGSVLAVVLFITVGPRFLRWMTQRMAREFDKLK